MWGRRRDAAGAELRGGARPELAKRALQSTNRAGTWPHISMACVVHLATQGRGLGFGTSLLGRGESRRRRRSDLGRGLQAYPTSVTGSGGLDDAHRGAGRLGKPCRGRDGASGGDDGAERVVVALQGLLRSNLRSSGTERYRTSRRSGCEGPGGSGCSGRAGSWWRRAPAPVRQSGGRG